MPTPETISLKVAVKVTDDLSLGAGINYQRLDATLSQSVAYSGIALGAAGQIAASTGNPALVPGMLALLGPTGLAREGVSTVQGDSWGWGWNVGASLEIGHAAHVAAIYRSAVQHDVEGDVEFADACHEATGGNPLLLGALLDALSSEGIAPKAKNAERVYEIGPEAVSRSVSLRLSRLPAEATSLAQAVAVLGDDVRLSDAATLAGIDRELAAHTAATLARNGLLRAERRLAFVHPVVRASVYAELNGEERERKHAAAAALLAEASAPTEQVAAHLLLTRPGSIEAATGLLP